MSRTTFFIPSDDPIISSESIFRSSSSLIHAYSSTLLRAVTALLTIAVSASGVKGLGR